MYDGIVSILFTATIDVNVDLTHKLCTALMLQPFRFFLLFLYSFVFYSCVWFLRRPRNVSFGAGKLGSNTIMVELTVCFSRIPHDATFTIGSFELLLFNF